MSGDPSAPAERFAIDSRGVKPGDVFVAIKGERSDGNDFAAVALKNGASGAIVTRDVADLPSGVPVLRVPDAVAALQDVARRHRASSSSRVTGVTGSNGKTTTKEMISRVLSVGGNTVFASTGNHNSRIGLPLMVMELEPRHTHAVFEMGASEKGDIAALASVAKPRTGVLTNVGRAHLLTFGTQEGVADAKWELVDALPSDGLAVLNADDPRILSRRSRAKSRVTTYGLSAEADVRGLDVRPLAREGKDGTAFNLTVRGEKSVSVWIPVPGYFNVSNALAAAVVGLEEGVALDDIVRGLESFQPPAQRMQARRGKGGALFVIDAYNANPDSMKVSLQSFAAAYGGRRRVAVLGGMRELGTATADEHRALGSLAGRLDLSKVFFLGEECSWVREGWPSGSSVLLECFADKTSLREALAQEPDGGVYLFKASRGVKMEEVYEPLIEG